MKIGPKELKDKLLSGTVPRIIDVREKLEFYTYNIGGENIPLGQIAQYAEDAEDDRTEEIVVVCQRGLRSATAQRILLEAGFTQVKNLTGGLIAYQRSNSFNP